MDTTTNHQNIVKRFKKKAAHSKTSKSNKRSSSQQDSLKVVYISSPMKVKTSASKFRSIVQQLTGKDSDIERYLDDDTNKLGDFYEFGDCNNGEDEARVLATSSDETASPNSLGSGSFLGAIDEVFTSEEMEDIFCLNLFSDDISSCDDDKADVLGSYDDLLL